MRQARAEKLAFLAQELADVEAREAAARGAAAAAAAAASPARMAVGNTLERLRGKAMGI